MVKPPAVVATAVFTHSNQQQGWGNYQEVSCSLLTATPTEPPEHNSVLDGARGHSQREVTVEIAAMLIEYIYIIGLTLTLDIDRYRFLLKYRLG